jgi:hypothetical protein
MERDGKQDPAIPCAALPIPMIAGVLISFLFVGTAVGVVLVNRRKKPAP